jgi:CRP-like cAMP-binding protein
MAILNLFQYVKDYKSIPAGEMIFSENDTGHEMYVIIEGEVDVSFNGRFIESVGPGSLVGEMALIDHKTRSATATAKTDCKVVAIDERRFTFMVQETPHFALEVMKIMADRLRRELSRDSNAPQPVSENGVKN